MDPGEEFFSNLLVGQNEQSDWVQNMDNGKNDPINDDASQFTATSINNKEARDMYCASEHCPDDVRDNNITTNSPENTIIFYKFSSIRAEPNNAPNLPNNAPDTQINLSIPPNHECIDDEDSMPKGRSMANNIIPTSAPGRLYRGEPIRRQRGQMGDSSLPCCWMHPSPPLTTPRKPTHNIQ